MVIAHDDIIERVEGFNVVKRRDPLDNKLRLISGGGSGHEPSHGGFVGKGMLDAAVAASVNSQDITVVELHKEILERKVTSKF